MFLSAQFPGLLKHISTNCFLKLHFLLFTFLIFCDVIPLTAFPVAQPTY